MKYLCHHHCRRTMFDCHLHVTLFFTRKKKIIIIIKQVFRSVSLAHVRKVYRYSSRNRRVAAVGMKFDRPAAVKNPVLV